MTFKNVIDSLKNERRPYTGIIIIMFMCMMVFLAGDAFAGFLGDYGDVQVGDASDNIEAYPGVLSRFPSFYEHKNTVFLPQNDAGTWLNPGATFCLGTVMPTYTYDTDQNPALPENDAFPLVVLENLGINPLATLIITVFAEATHDGTLPVYLNVFCDQNRDGQWKDGYYSTITLGTWDLEWMVQDIPLFLTPGDSADIAVSNIRLATPTEDHWLRLVLSDVPLGEYLRPYPGSGVGFWDITMPPSHDYIGEVEDFLLKYYSDPGMAPVFHNRASGVVLKNKPRPDPKPSCYLRLREFDYNRTLSEQLQPFMLWLPWCADGKRQFGLEFKMINTLGGCDPPAEALLTLYGPKWEEGVPSPPVLFRSGIAGGVGPGPGGGALNAGAVLCNAGLTGPSPDPLKPGYPKWDNDCTPIDPDLLGPSPPRPWEACFNNPRRWRLYSSITRTMTEGCVIQNPHVTAPPPTPTNLALEDYAEVGQEMKIYFGAGDLVENFMDMAEGREFPDPDFVSFSTSGTAAELVTEPVLSTEGSFFLQEGTYTVIPSIPDHDFVRAEMVSFWYLGDPASVTLVSFEGDPLVGEIPYYSWEEWAEYSFDIPEDFDLEEISITMANGFIDSLIVHLCPVPGEPYEDDCNENEIDDETDIQEGTSTDYNDNNIPDECESGVTCCVGIRGNANGDEGQSLNISDITYLVAMSRRG